MEILAIFFVVPAVYFGLLYFGILTHEKMRYHRRWSWLAILVAAALITPTGDMLTLLFLAAPLILEHEIILFTSCLRERRTLRIKAWKQSS